jgi:hypothetical protein
MVQIQGAGDDPVTRVGALEFFAFVMNRAHRSPFSLTRMFKSSKPVLEDIDDLNAVEKSFRRSSFTLLPSASTPSRAPSNTLIASSQAASLEAPVRFHIPYGR